MRSMAEGYETITGPTAWLSPSYLPVPGRYLILLLGCR